MYLSLSLSLCLCLFLSLSPCPPTRSLKAMKKCPWVKIKIYIYLPDHPGDFYLNIKYSLFSKAYVS